MSGLTSAAARRSERGIALIITLILLSVTLIMAVAFLAVSSRERGSVTTESDTTTARLAADAALAHAEAQIMANVLSTTNPYSFGLIVSTNYINPNGYLPTNGFNPNNVNYDYLVGGGPVTGPNFLQNVANLLYLPRAPVYITTNPFAPPDFRFYLDLNRNGRYDPNGVVTNVDNNLAGLGTASFEVGDPEWIGGLTRADVPHGPNNQFIYRYAFIAVPIGNALDLNYIHNQSSDTIANRPLNPPNDEFLRNQGVGSWEINLAAFLTDLNTNEWGQDVGLSPNFYQYNEPGLFDKGVAFDDALSLLAWRYNYNYNSLNSVDSLYGGPLGAGHFAFLNDGIDGYSDGPLQTTFDTNADYFPDTPSLPWSGADNTNRFFDLPDDLFDTTKSSVAFVGRLTNSGAGNATYDRYTFYRLLSQLGTDSSPESGKININYDNVTVTNNSASPTNFLAWTPLGFFTNAADRMLRAYTALWMGGSTNNFNNFTNTFGANITNAFGVTNIPVYMNGQFVYSPAIQRVLQLAANIYDATTNNAAALGNNYPSVFKPLFNRDSLGNIFISGYEQIPFVAGIGDPALVLPVDVTDPSVGVTPNVNVYGVPWIIGAKKGFPNFNEFSLASLVDVTRRLQITRPTITSPISSFQTNQMYIMGISNYLGIECWNSYVSPYTNQIDILVRSSVVLMLTNDAGMSPRFVNPTYSILLSTNPWPGSVWQSGGRFYPYAGSFQIPLYTNFILIPDLVYRYSDSPPDFVSTNGLNPLFERTTSFPLPQFGLLMTNRLQVIMIDHFTERVIDYVSFNGPNTSRNLNSEFADPDGGGTTAYAWSTNYLPNTTLPYGVYNQILISQETQPGGGGPPIGDGLWHSDPEASGTPPYQQAFFNAFFQPNNIGSAVGWGNYTTPQTVTATNLQLSVQAPYTPTRYGLQTTSWQANDPLVHYTATDLNYTTNTPSRFNYGYVFTNLLPNIGKMNNHYQPWGGYPDFQVHSGMPDYNMALKDPQVFRSDDWDFPTDKFPTVGWLGRVHRGTPWQTVFLKATNILASANSFSVWQNWTGNFNSYDAANAGPVQDRLLFDIFTTAFNDNATRGQLSINIPSPNLAAWSALFSGVTVLSNTASAGAVNRRQAYVPEPPLLTTNFPINPAGVNGVDSTLYSLAAAIDATRATFTNADGLVGSFEHVGDILSTPQLTQQSPFLNLPVTNGINDEMYEWLPQQTMSLLRVSSAPRYVIYSYGQALKPAPGGIVTSSSFFGMITNYQVTAEMATRAVVRFESMATNMNGTLTVTNNKAVIESFNILPPD